MSPWSWGVSPSWHPDAVNPEALCGLGVFMQASPPQHDPLFTHSPAPLPSSEVGSEAESSKLLFMAWFFL